MALDQPRSEPLQSGDELREEFRIAQQRLRLTYRGAGTVPAPPGPIDERTPAASVGVTRPGDLP